MSRTRGSGLPYNTGMPRELSLRFPPETRPDEIPPEDFVALVAQELGCDEDAIGSMRLDRTSFDARRDAMYWLAQLTVWMDDEEVPPPPPDSPQIPPPPTASAPHVVVVGSGPAGLFCCLELQRAGMRTTLLERGKQVQARRRDIAELNRGGDADPESNYCFGEGGAGTYSDGKLYTRSGKREQVRPVLEELVAHGAPETILWSWRPHIGSNRLPQVVEALRNTLSAAGTVRFEARVDALLVKDGHAAGVRLADGEEIAADSVVLATGHSALDALRMAAAAGAQLEAKGFAMGVRVEHPQAWLDRIQYHGLKEEADLPPSFYELATQANERGVYSFCMCPGGWIVPSQAQPGTLVVNGMSLSKRDSPYANSGIVVEVRPKDWCGKRGWRWGWSKLLQDAAALSDLPLLHEVVEDPRGGAPLDVAAGRLPVHPAIDPLFGVRLQTALEVLAAHHGGGGGRAPAQRCSDFAMGRITAEETLPTSFVPGLTMADFDQILPKGIATRLREGMIEFDRSLHDFAGPKGQMIGVETRTSSPVRLLRDTDSMQAEGLPGLYPCGEGAGHAGGIMSAALDGQRVARALSSALKAAGSAG